MEMGRKNTLLIVTISLVLVIAIIAVFAGDAWTVPFILFAALAIIMRRKSGKAVFVREIHTVTSASPRSPPLS